MAFGSVPALGKLGRFCTAPGDVELSTTNVFQPDIFFISQDRLAIAKRSVHGTPNLAIELVSPGSRRTDYMTKRAL